MVVDAGGPVRPVVIGAPNSSWHGRARRVAADVDGHEVWFESDDIALVPSPEAFASSIVIPSLLADRPLVSTRPLDPTWLDGAAAVVAQAARWWDVRARPVEADAARRPWWRRPPPAAEPSAALCFTGDVDSFHALLTSAPPPDLLLLAIGYDIALDDVARADDARRRVRAVAGAVGARAAIVTTNLREHPLHRATTWESVHGGALAALAMVTGTRGTLSIPAGSPSDHDRPWGTHRLLDRHWSTSDLTVRHVGDDAPWEDKVAALAAHPLALDHLWVCRERVGSVPNCGRCDACLVTATVVHHAGALDRATTLPIDGAHELADRLSGLWTTTHAAAYRRLLDDGLAEPVRPAVRSLLVRAGAARA